MPRGDKYIPVDLTSGLQSFKLVEDGTSCYEVILLTTNPASPAPDISVQIGRSGDQVPFVVGQYWKDDTGCNPESSGIFLDAPAQPGVIANFYVSFSGANAGLSGV